MYMFVAVGWNTNHRQNQTHIDAQMAEQQSFKISHEKSFATLAHKRYLEKKYNNHDNEQNKFSILVSVGPVVSGNLSGSLWKIHFLLSL